MREIIIDRVLPSPEAADSLHVALKSALVDRCAGISTGKGQIRVALTDKATAEDDNTARQIVLAHDFTQRTPEQTARAERKQLRDIAHAKAKDSKATKDELIAYLMLQVEYLSDRLGDAE